MEQVDRQFEFHRLARSWPQYRWWRPLVTGLLGVAFYLAFTVVLLVIGAIIALATSADIERYMEAAAAIDLSDPVIFAFTLVSLILMIPSLALAALITGPRPIGLLSSVAGRIRWRWLAVCTVAALAVFLASLALSTAIGFLLPEEAGPAPVQQETSTLLILLALSILAVPFQAAAEEYVFRGFLMQAIGSWLRHPAFAILLPVPLFVLGHGYDPLGQTDVAIFAIFAGWISWRTGGLEAAIAVHAINNMTIFVLGAFGLVDVNSTEGSVSGLLVSVVTMAVTAAVIIRLADRRGVDRTRTAGPDPVVQPTPAFSPFPGQFLPGQPFQGQPFQGQPLSAGGYAALPSPSPAAWNQGRPEGSAGPARDDAPSPYDPFQYDPSRYDSSRYLRAPEASSGSAARPEPRVEPAPTPAAPRPVAPVSPPPAAPGVPSTPPSAQATPRDHALRHPSGPAHPAGPGYPSGTPHPAGPGHPGAEPSAPGAVRAQEDDPRRSS